MVIRYLFLGLLFSSVVVVQASSDFSANVRVGCSPLLVRFGATNIQSFSSLQWDLDNDGIIDVKDSILTYYVYSKPGDYSVKLIVTDSSGQRDSIVKINYIHVSTPPRIDPVDSTSICEGTRIQIVRMVTGGIRPYSYRWEATGRSSIIRDSVLEFVADSTRIWTATVTDSVGCSGQIRFQVRVIPKPEKPRVFLQNFDFVFTTAQAVSYQWYRNGQMINGARDSFHLSMEDPGFYQVEVFDKNGCSNISDSILVSRVIIGSVTTQPEGWHIYPSTVTSDLFIQRLELGTKAQIQLYNVLGIFQASATIGDGDEVRSIDMSTFPAGMYVLSITEAQRRQVYKVLKE